MKIKVETTTKKKSVIEIEVDFPLYLKSGSVSDFHSWDTAHCITENGVHYSLTKREHWAPTRPAEFEFSIETIDLRSELADHMEDRTKITRDAYLAMVKEAATELAKFAPE